MNIRKSNLSLILSLLFLLCSFPVYADTNGVWHDARDVRGGIFGSDEGFPSFFFNSTVFFEEEGRIEMGGNPIENASEVDAEQIETSYMVDREDSFRYVDPSQNTQLTDLYVNGELTIGGMTSQLEMENNTINNIKEICFEDGTCMNSPASGVPPGTLMPYAGGSTCPEGWSEYENARGRFILGSSSTYMPGDKGGEEEVRLTVEQMPSHSHEEKFINVNNKNRGNRNLGIATNSYRYGQTSETGGDEPHNNMPPYVALTWCKKDAGGSGGGSPTGNGSGITRPLDMKNTQINNVAEPTENDDAATKGYVDGKSLSYDRTRISETCWSANCEESTTTSKSWDHCSLNEVLFRNTEPGDTSDDDYTCDVSRNKDGTWTLDVQTWGGSYKKVRCSANCFSTSFS